MSNTEIVVVGVDIAGPSTALTTTDTEHNVTLVTKAELVEPNTYHAQGGTTATVFPDSNPKLHVVDTMATGYSLCNPKAVDILTHEGAEHVREFVTAGAHLDRDAQGHMLHSLEAAHSRAHVVCAGRDTTGKAPELGASAMMYRDPHIHIIEDAFPKDLIMQDSHIADVRLLISGWDKDLAVDRVILAAGGTGRIYPYTTNPLVATVGDLAATWYTGAQVASLEFCRFHPTIMVVDKHFLVSGTVHGEDAMLLDEYDHRYVKGVDPYAELTPRDVVAHENFRAIQAQGGKPMMLDILPMTRENPDLASLSAHQLLAIDAYTRSLGFNWNKGPVPVAPAVYYYMGDIHTGLNARTFIPGLYVADECAHTGVIDFNRLTSGSLLEGLVYGRRVGLAAIVDDDDAVQASEPFLNSAADAVFDHTPVALIAPAATVAANDTTADKVQDRTRIQNTVRHGVSVLRDEARLKTTTTELGQGLTTVNAQADIDADGTVNSVEAPESRDMLTTGCVVATATLARIESKGTRAHADYSEPVNSWAHSVIYIKD